MSNSILFVGKKVPKWLKSIEKIFDVKKSKEALKGFKEIFKSVPDVIIFNITDSFYEGYYLSKLLSQSDLTGNIPFVISSDAVKVPENIDLNAVAQIASDLDGEEVVSALKNIISQNKLSKSDKDKILKYPPTSKDVKMYTQIILDELHVNSSIVEEFKSLIDSMNYDNVLAENIVKIINRYISYDVAGIFINDSDEASRNVLNLSVPNNNVTLKLTEDVRDQFFFVF